MTVLIDDFMCTCKPEGLARCVVTLDDAYQILGGGSTHPKSSKITPGNFLTRAVQWLNFEHRAFITDIMTDMWSAVIVKQYPPYVEGSDEDREPVVIARVQCDEVEHGLARVIQALHHQTMDPVPE